MGMENPLGDDSSIHSMTSYGFPTHTAGAAPTATRPHLSVVPNDFDALFDEIEDTWQDQALCAQTDPDAFFPEQGGSSRQAKAICTQCPVRRECLTYALDNAERFGVWGGYSERERRVIARSRMAHQSKDSDVILPLPSRKIS